MKLKKIGLLALLALPPFFLCAVPSAQTIAVGSGSGMRGGAVSVPVSLAGSADYTAALVRVQYDPAILESASAVAGPLASAGHVIDYHSPAAGRLNVTVYADSGMPAFTAQSGTLLTLNFRIKRSATPGDSAITFATSGTPGLPSSDLTDTTGAVANPTATPGSVSVGGTAARESWMLYR